MTHSHRGFSRRRFMQNAGIALAAAAAGDLLLPRSLTRAKAASATDNVIRVLGVSNGAPKSWDEFTKATGFTVEWTPLGDDVGTFLHEMMANDGGERYDVVTCLSGAYQPLVEQSLLTPIDTSKLKNWGGVGDNLRRTIPEKAPEQLWGMPFQVNADSFAYFVKELGEPDAPAEVSWKILYDDPRTMGKVALDNGIYGILCCAIYLAYHKIVDIKDIAAMTDSELQSVADYLIERKKAGQFRTFYGSLDEQIQLLTSREVLAESAWEPAAIEAKAKGLDVAYAYTVEGYDKWAQNLMIPTQVLDRKAEDKAYALIDWFMGGAYAAEMSAEQGYITARPDLGIAYAQEHGWSAEKIAAIEACQEKLKVKFAKDLFVDPGYFGNMEAYEREVARFKNA
jgi:putative spermidine/putrescine transport system substrate-binding protein